MLNFVTCYSSTAFWWIWKQLWFMASRLCINLQLPNLKGAVPNHLLPSSSLWEIWYWEPCVFQCQSSVCNNSQRLLICKKSVNLPNDLNFSPNFTPHKVSGSFCLHWDAEKAEKSKRRECNFIQNWNSFGITRRDVPVITVFLFSISSNFGFYETHTCFRLNTIRVIHQCFERFKSYFFREKVVLNLGRPKHGWTVRIEFRLIRNKFFP